MSTKITKKKFPDFFKGNLVVKTRSEMFLVLRRHGVLHKKANSSWPHIR